MGERGGDKGLDWNQTQGRQSFLKLENHLLSEIAVNRTHDEQLAFNLVITMLSLLSVMMAKTERIRSEL